MRYPRGLIGRGHAQCDTSHCIQCRGLFGFGVLGLESGRHPPRGVADIYPMHSTR